MMDTHELDRRILSNLLATMNGSAVDSHHPDDETLTLFVEGALKGATREDLLQHLDRCDSCRRAAGVLMSLPAEEEARAIVAPQPNRWSWQQIASLAIAACLLVTVGLLSFPRGTSEIAMYEKSLRLLTSKKFAEAHDLLALAAEQGIESDRLRSLDAQALRKIPDPNALAYAGRLTDFGFDGTGAIARDPGAAAGDEVEKAAALLRAAGSTSPEVILNRGHVLLAQDRPNEALAEFETACRLAPQNPLAWLGRGLANYVLDKMTEAEADFRRAIELDPENVAARVNLAMTLGATGKTQEALEAWQSLLAGSLTQRDRETAQQAIEYLRRNASQNQNE